MSGGGWEAGGWRTEVSSEKVKVGGARWEA